MKITGFKNGCGIYWGLMAEVPGGRNLLEVQERMRKATVHRENCPKCKAINGALVNQFFCDEVIVGEGNEL